MEGKRFGFGLAAGLLLGLATVVASAGFGTGSLYGSLGAPGQYPAATTATSSTITEAVTTTGQSPYPIGGLVPPSQKNVTQGGATATTTTQGSMVFGNSSGNSASLTSLSSLSSNVQSIPHQPLLSNAVIFIPVFVAFMLGAVIYRASRQPVEEEG